MTVLRGIVVPAMLAVLAAPAAAAPADDPSGTSCTICHGDPELFGEEGAALVDAHRADVHASFGFSCHDCHGGNPDRALAEDGDAAMATSGPNPFRGTPSKVEIPAFCGRCHSDPSYMKRFRPDARIDQEREYWTSYHGVALRNGDLRVAACTDCHGVHGIRRADDPLSAVYPTRVADTCGTCHSSAERMAGTVLPGGRPIPVDQVARWRGSVHGRALMEKGDLFAPTCNDCHGNHGAAPPGLESVTFVCGQCHGREAALLRASPKHAGFVKHNALLAKDPASGCAACHRVPEPSAALTNLRELGQCTACHGNHGVQRPTTALLGELPETPCQLCHDAATAPGVPSEPASRLANFARHRDELVARADAMGLTTAARYDWLVDRALELPFHTLAGGERVGERPALRPEFERLFRKFRVGKTEQLVTDPATGHQHVERVRMCADCHAERPALAPAGVGLRVARELVRKTQALDALIARAERILLTAKRGGVEVGEAEVALDQAVGSQIELQALVHSFSVEPDSPFLETHAVGMEHATAALQASHEALRELSVRRRGLTASLVFIVFVLVGLGLVIHGRSRAGALG